MGATPVCQITAAGVVRPDFDACLGYVQALYRSIYGVDLYLGADSQDGQFMALLANAIHDCNGEDRRGLQRLLAFDRARRWAVVGRQDQRHPAHVANGLDQRRSHRRPSQQRHHQWGCPGREWQPLGPARLRHHPERRAGSGHSDVPSAWGHRRPCGTITGIATPTLGWQSVTNPQAAAVGALWRPTAPCGSARLSRPRCPL